MQIVEKHENGAVTVEIDVVFHAGSERIAREVEEELLRQVGSANVVARLTDEQSDEELPKETASPVGVGRGPATVAPVPPRSE